MGPLRALVSSFSKQAVVIDDHVKKVQIVHSTMDYLKDKFCTEHFFFISEAANKSSSTRGQATKRGGGVKAGPLFIFFKLRENGHFFLAFSKMIFDSMIFDSMT